MADSATKFSNNSIPALERDLREVISGEVRFDAGSRALYATDASNYRQVPLGVVVPRTIDDVVRTIAVARKHNAPLLNRGGGTSLAGQCCNVAVVLDSSKYLNEILEVNGSERFARVHPGVVLDRVREAAEKYHLTFAPDPATHNHCTLGGMIGNNSCGAHSVLGGKTDENIESLDIVTYRGDRMTVGPTSEAEFQKIVAAGGPKAEIYSALKSLIDRYAPLIRERFPNIPRRVSGFNLNYLLPENGFDVAKALVGTEGTCVTILEARLRLIESPQGRSLLVLGFDDIFTAADRIEEVIAACPIAIEGFDDVLIEGMRANNLNTANIALLPEGHGWLLIEFGGKDKLEADQRANDFARQMSKGSKPPSSKLCADSAEAARIWKIRESALGASARVPGRADAHEGWDDAAVAPEKLGAYLREQSALYAKYGYKVTLYGHFGQGCVHSRVTFDLHTAEGIRNFRAFLFEAAELVVKYGGSLSGEHGDGQARGELLPVMYGDELVQAFREFKSIWDPDWKMNPGKVVDPFRTDENLRHGIDFHPEPLATQFQFPNDDGSFNRAMERCVGVGECRRMEKSTMCPSYRVTMEEQHSTRGRARLLWEMMTGEVIKDGWRSEAVKQALDLCLACKGCKGDCPVGVDVATYKAEFLSHYYEGRIRPRTAYSLGLIYWWAKMASAMPGFVNFLTQTPGLSDLAKRIAGIAPERTIPKFAQRTFRSWFERRAIVNAKGKPVLLWPDTFNNYFHPEIAIATVEVLEHAGYRVMLPEKSLCCGRPLYDHGMIGLAKSLLTDTVKNLTPLIDQDIPMVGMEPSCLAVFRDEMVNLMPSNLRAQKLSRSTFTLSEFLENSGSLGAFGNITDRVTYHGHCHQKAVMGTTAEEHVLRALGANLTNLDSGCCGMAGAFGFEQVHFEISQKVGELIVLPAVRAMGDQEMIIADGFSCREQVAQGTGREPLHMAQVLRKHMNR